MCWEIETAFLHLKYALSAAAVHSRRYELVIQELYAKIIIDLIGSLCDLTSGSGDKGTPVVLVQGYFDNYTN